MKNPELKNYEGIILECPICHVDQKKSGMLDHLGFDHGRLINSKYPDTKLLSQCLGMARPPMCCNPGCHEVCEFDFYNFSFRSTCQKHRVDPNPNFKPIRPIYWDKFFCSICKEWVDGVWMHKRVKHRDLDDTEFLRRFLELDEVPKCKNCGRNVPMRRDEHRFKEFCHATCRSRYHFKVRDKTNRRNNQFGATKVETAIYVRFLRLFPEERIRFGIQIEGITTGILFEDRKLIVEVDRNYFERYKEDLERDKKLYELGYKIRRLNEAYLRDIPTDNDLRYLIIIESQLETPYYERIPFEDMVAWRKDVTQTGPRKLLTYNK